MSTILTTLRAVKNYTKESNATNLATGKETTSLVLESETGTDFVWDRATNEIILTLGINVASKDGVEIHGMKKGDKIQIISASGLASFDKETPINFTNCALFVLNEGANLAIGKATEGPIEDQLKEWTKKLPQPSKNATKIRNAFGVEPKSNLKARAEGGLLVCLPHSSEPQVCKRGRENWIKNDGVRVDTNIPDYIKNAFFVMDNNPEHNARIAPEDGTLRIQAWDSEFNDNIGIYVVQLKLTQVNTK